MERILLIFLLLICSGNRASLGFLIKNAKSRLGLRMSRDIDKILAEQGISIDNLLALQRSILNESPDTTSVQSEVNREISQRKKEERAAARLLRERRQQRRTKLAVHEAPAIKEASGPNQVADKPNTVINIVDDKVEDTRRPRPARIEPEVRVKGPVDQDNFASVAISIPPSGRRKSIPHEDLQVPRQAAPRARNAEPRRVELTGVTLQNQLELLVQRVGFEELHAETGMRCFTNKPSVASSLKALRTPSAEWARKRIEFLYIREMKNKPPAP